MGGKKAHLASALSIVSRSLSVSIVYAPSPDVITTGTRIIIRTRVVFRARIVMKTRIVIRTRIVFRTRIIIRTTIVLSTSTKTRGTNSLDNGGRDDGAFAKCNYRYIHVNERGTLPRLTAFSRENSFLAIPQQSAACG